MTTPMKKQTVRRRRVAHGALVAMTAILGLHSMPAQAGSTEAMLGFYLSLKVIQVAALSGTADMWEALGMTGKAQECRQLGADLDRGELAGGDNNKMANAKQAELAAFVTELQEAEVPLTAAEQAAARKAYGKIAVTALGWAGVSVAGFQVATANDMSTIEKIAVGALMSLEVAKAARATRDLATAWKSYRDMNSDPKPLEPSKEMALQFASL